jgi:hypothetical protein
MTFSLFLLSSFLFISCSSNFGDVKFDSAQKNSYIVQLTTSRLRKDALFKSVISSPLTPEQRASFQHLEYYPANFGLIFRVSLVSDDHDTPTGIPATGGEIRPAVKFGEFHFEVDGKKVALHVYKMTSGDTSELFLPFTDETCGKTSYSGGRYIDLKEGTSGIYMLDFNYAYNPYCAYNHNYSCPIVPRENHLDVPVTAGGRDEVLKREYIIRHGGCSHGGE